MTAATGPTSSDCGAWQKGRGVGPDWIRAVLADLFPRG
jgi:hypothetical protein